MIFMTDMNLLSDYPSKVVWRLNLLPLPGNYWLLSISGDFPARFYPSKDSWFRRGKKRSRLKNRARRDEGCDLTLAALLWV
jgi:hypothetical protein